MKLPLTSITIGPRQRLEVDLSMVESMSDPAVGQILPIIVDQNNVLIDGFHRLTKAKELGWTEIEVSYKEPKTPYDAQLMELYADIHRKGRTWQEQALSILKLHEMRPSLTVKQLAIVHGKSHGHVGEYLNIAYELRKAIKQETEADKELWQQDGIYGAFKVLAQRVLKQYEAEMNRRKMLTVAQSNLGKSTAREEVKKLYIELFPDLPTASEELSNIQKMDITTSPPSTPTVIKICCNTNEHTTVAFTNNIFQTDCNFIFLNRERDFITLQDSQTSENSDFKVMSFPIIWNCMEGRVFPDWPFSASYRLIALVTLKSWQNKARLSIPSVITEPIFDKDDDWPSGLFQTLLDAVCLEGEKVFVFDPHWIVPVAQANRIPVWMETDDTKRLAQIKKLQAYYRVAFGDVTFV